MSTQTKQQDDHGREQAAAQYSTLAEMVAAVTCDYDRLEELRDAWESLYADAQPIGRNFVEFVKTHLTDPEHYQDAEEYLALADQAGDCTSQDDARERIQEDPLSVEVRSDWQSPGETLTPSQFCILLCTGGPAVRILGDLDEHGQPDRAWIEYQDWFTPWTQYFDTDQDTLLTYCREFYYGE